ncbi:MAG: hypothetical protein H6736_18980 [Alphaproteobacteria bacterium]|nr:hypothetical protein [Alphaproteobacteria bacterium]
MRKTLIVASLTLLTACGFSPAEGSWQANIGTLTANACGDQFAATEITQPDPETLTLTDEGFTFGDATCTLSGKDFDCGTQEISTDVQGTVLYNRISNSGAFDDAENASGNSMVELDCDGTDCPTYEGLLGLTFPCEATYAYTISYVGE